MTSLPADTFDEFMQDLQDPQRRETILESLNIALLLGDCIVDRTYKVPDHLAAAIQLSALGERIFGEILEKKSSPKPNELKLALYLSFACAAGVLIDSTMSLHDVRSSLTREVLTKRISYANIFGRELSDNIASNYPQRTLLDPRQSLTVVRSMSTGVFQMGHTTVGPLGFLPSPEARFMPATRNVPGYLCSDTTCPRVHAIRLSTASELGASAAIIKARDTVGEHLRRLYRNTEDRHVKPLRDAQVHHYGLHAKRYPEATIEGIADTMSTGELRDIARQSLIAEFASRGTDQTRKSMVGFVNSPQDYLAKDDRGAIIQSLLLMSDRSIVRAVDACIRDGRVKIQESEIRTRRHLRFSKDGIRAEFGSLGIRFVGPARQTTDRLLELLHHIYFKSGTSSPEELRYSIGAPKAVSEARLLELALRSHDTTELLQKCALGGLRESRAAYEFLNMGELPEDRTEALHELLWKLGTPSDQGFEDIDRVRRHIEEVRQSISQDFGAEQLRGPITNLFTSVEDVLQFSLEYTTWALTEDRYASQEGFAFDGRRNGSRTSFIDDRAPDPIGGRLKPDGKNTIAPLGAAYSRLRKALAGLSENEFRRRNEDIPATSRFGDRPFAYPSIIPFFNLSPEAREQVLEDLSAISAIIQGETMLRARNSSLHGNSNFPHQGRVLRGSVGLDAWLSICERGGYYPSIFRLKQISGDLLGRQILTYTRSRYALDDYEVNLLKPTWTIAPRLPASPTQLLIAPAFELPSVGPMRFSIRTRSIADAYWEGWPQRLQASVVYGGRESSNIELSAEAMD